MTRNKMILIAAVLAALAAGWYFGSPRWTLWQMGEAAEARDSDKLAAYIDFPTLRETTKAQMKAQLMAKARQGGQDGFGTLGAMMGMAMIDPVVDSALTPETMRAAFAKAPEPRAKAPGATPGDSASAGSGGGKRQTGAFGIDATDVEIDQNGLNEFRLRKKGAKGKDGDLIFRRHGLGWKLEEVRIAAD